MKETTPQPRVRTSAPTGLCTAEAETFDPHPGVSCLSLEETTKVL
jgi:hypothetical protein